MALPAGTVIEATSDKDRTVSFKKSAGTAAGTKTAIEVAVAAAYEKGEYADPERVTELAVALHGGTPKKPMTITLEEAQEKLKSVLDNPKKRAVPVKKAEGAAPAPAAALKEFKISDVQKGVAAAGKAENLFYNADAVTNAYRSESTLEAAMEKALAKMRENKPAKAAAAAAKVTEAQRAAAEKKAEREAEAAAKRNAEAAARIAKRLGGPAGAAPAGRNAAWEAEVEEEHERCVASCESKKAEKLAAGRAAYTRKRATTAKTAGPAGNGAAAANNSGEALSSEEAWDMFTSGLPGDIVAFVSTPKQRAALEKTVQYKAWVGIYAGSKSKGKAELAKYKASVQKAVGKKLAEVKAALAAVPAGNGAARKRRGGGSRKNRSTRGRKNRNTRRRRN
jgi:hypothetical protein